MERLAERAYLVDLERLHRAGVPPPGLLREILRLYQESGGIGLNCPGNSIVRGSVCLGSDRVFKTRNERGSLPSVRMDEELALEQRRVSQSTYLISIVTVTIAAFLCWHLGRKYGGSDQSALLALALFVMCFALLLSPLWLYSWDFIDIIVFILFIDFVLSGMSLRWFIGLFAIAIWNRDSAIFIALYLILDPLVRFFYQRHYKLLPSTPLDWRRMFAGAICIPAGLLILELLKRSLLVEEVGDPNSSFFGNSYNITLLNNILVLKESLTHFTREFWITVPAFLVMVTALGACLVRRDPQRYLTIYLIELSLLVSLFSFGVFFETRIYLILIPFVVISGVLLSCSKNAGTKAKV